MLNNLIFCLNATVPIFFLILLGMFLRIIQLVDDAFTARLNTLVFRICLPALLFHDMYRTDYRTNWNTAYVVYCALATLASILICIGVSYLLKDRSIQGEFIQTSFRSSATPLGIIAMGASFQWEKSRQSAGPALVSTFIKLFGLCALFLPLGVHLGFRNDLLVAALVMCGSSTTISCFVMAKGMGHKGDLTISTVMLTTLLSSFSLTFWLFILKSHGWI